jgi:predicted permease
MFLLILTGFLCYKTKIISATTNGQLSNLILLIINPAVIIYAYHTEFKSELFFGLIVSFGLATISHIIGIIVGKIFVKKKGHENYPIERFCVIYSNCGFMAIPLVNAIFGLEGVFYLTAYITVFNVFIWTQGVFLMTQKRSFKEIIGALRSPVLISVGVGLVLFFTQIKLPTVAISTIKYISLMNTPLAMIVAGIFVAQTNILKAFKNLRIYYISFLKLLVVPLISLLIFKALNITDTVLLVIVIATACPTATTSILFASRFGKDAPYASENLTVTTLLSILTIPFVVFISKLI